ncbi:MAG: site-specific integrase [Thiohalobacteraceae bacterium]
MSIYRDKERGCYIFEFDRKIEGKRVRARKLLPKTWTRAQADAYDRQESARLYAVATRVERHEYGIEDAVAIYLKERVPKLKSGDNIIGELAQMFWAYQGRPITELPEVCKEYAAKGRKEDGGPLSAATIRNRIRYLTSACRYGWKHHGMCEHDPAARVIVPTVRNERRFFIDRRQMLEVARACRCRSTRAAIRIAFYSGMRLGEIIKARRTPEAFLLDDTKNGEPRHVPVHPRVRVCLKVRMRESSKMSKYFREARRAVGMDWLHFHDLRHSAASEMINAGVDLYTVGAVLGHKSATSTKRYSHLATDSLRTALDKIGRKAA